MPIPAYANDRGPVLERISARLGTLDSASAAAYFGSTAARSADRLSNVDLLVHCSPAGAIQFIRGLHTDLQIALACPMEGREPSGSYWFATTNPFLRLDVGFHTYEEYVRAMSGVSATISGPFLAVPTGVAEVLPGGASEIPLFTRADRAFAVALRRFQESVKATVRGTQPAHPLHKIWEMIELLDSTHVTSDAWELYERSFAEYEAAILHGEG